MEKSFKIYLDSIVFSIQKFGGASTYWKELLLEFIKKNNVCIIVQTADFKNLNADGQQIINLLDKNKVALLVEDKLPVGILRYLPLTKRLPAKSLYHNSYYRSCLQKDVVNIFTVHDFTHKRGLASKFPRKLIHIGLTELGLKNADGIICISESTKRDLKYYYPQIPKDKIKVIYHGVSDAFFKLIDKDVTLNSFSVDLTTPFALFVGKRSGYKNFDIIPPALANIPNLNLVLVGGGEITEDERKILDIHIPNRYLQISNVSNEQLNILYNHAYCLIYTSLYEGFGIPVVEAMKAGCPVITNNLSSLGEVAGNAALIISDNTSEAIANEVLVLKDSGVRNEFIEKGIQRSKDFTWEKCFKETLSFYTEIYYKKFN